MEILTAIESRKSIRAYLNKPVPKDIINEILEKSLRSPTATNIQPWNIYAVSGEILDSIKKDNVNMFLSGVRPTVEEPHLEDVFSQRRRELAMDLFKLLEIERADKEKRKAWAARGCQYFDAPVAMVFTINKELFTGTWALLAIGSLVQTISLVAMEYGLGTCISEQGVSYHDILKQHIEISEDESIVISLSMGYPDPNSPANKLITRRAPLDDVTRWFGF